MDIYTQSQLLQLPMPFGNRGYTGHEQLNQFGIINMNARLYDPLLGRFLAPDPFVGSGMANDFNRYIYCQNNPLMFTDPSGESWKSFWSDFGNAFVRDFKRTFGGVNGFEIGYNSNGGGFGNALRGGSSFGPSIGISNSGQITTGNSQGGIHNMNSIGLSKRLDKSVVQAEQKARSEYFGENSFENLYSTAITGIATLPKALNAFSNENLAATFGKTIVAAGTISETIVTFGCLFLQGDTEDHSYLDKDEYYEEKGNVFKETIQTRNNENYFQNGPGYPNWMKWIMRVAGGAAAGEGLYDSWPRIDTTIVRPTYNYYYNSYQKK